MKKTIILLMSAFFLSCEEQSLNENAVSEKPAI